MKQVYPVVFTPMEEGGYLVTVPDLDINTSGTDMADAISMARDAISMWGVCEEDLGKPIPPSGSIPIHAGPEDIISLVDVDFDAYRRAHDTRAVRKNVTIPNYLNELAIQAGLNFSQILQEGLKARLDLQ